MGGCGHASGARLIERLERWPYWKRAALFALIAFLVTAVLELGSVFRQFDFDLIDTHGRILAPNIEFNDVAVIDVDEESMVQLQPKLGTWPYDREVYALVAQWLKQSGVRSVAFDIVFAESRKGDDALAAAVDGRFVFAAAELPLHSGAMNRI